MVSYLLCSVFLVPWEVSWTQCIGFLFVTLGQLGYVAYGVPQQDQKQLEKHTFRESGHTWGSHDCTCEHLLNEKARWASPTVLPLCFGAYKTLTPPFRHWFYHSCTFAHVLSKTHRDQVAHVCTCPFSRGAWSMKTFFLTLFRACW